MKIMRKLKFCLAIFLSCCFIQPGKTASCEKLPEPVRGCYVTDPPEYREPPLLFNVSEHYEPNMCTHIFYAFNNEFNLNFTDGLKELQQKQPNLKLLLSFRGFTIENSRYIYKMMENDTEFLNQFGGFSIENASSIYKITANDTEFLNKLLVEYMLRHGFDGIDLDLEYPRTKELLNDFSALIKEFRVALDDVGGGKKRYLLTASVAAMTKPDLVNEKSGKARYDVNVMMRNLDFINLMTYDFHGSGWEPTQLGHNAPLRGLDDFNVEASIQKWLDKGMCPQKLILGLASYGRGWSLPQGAAPLPKAGDRAEGESPQISINEKDGMFSYMDTCEPPYKDYAKIYDKEQGTMFLSGGNIWWSYDNEETIKEKLAFARKKNLGGAFYWQMENDDWRQLCGGRKFPLIWAMEDGLGTSNNKHTLRRKIKQIIT